MNKEKTLNKYIDKIENFLIKNKWRKEEGEEYLSFFHDNDYGIDIDRDTGEIIILSDIGDIFHISRNSNNGYYTLIGYLIIHPCELKMNNYIF